MNLLLLLLILPLLSPAQEIPKGVAKIIVNNDFSAKENFDYAVKILLDNDYFFEQKDSSIGYIKTQAKNMKPSGYFYLNIRAMDKKIQISGFNKLGMDLGFGGVTIKDDPDPIKNIGMKGSIQKKSFEAMLETANKFEGTKTFN